MKRAFTGPAMAATTLLMLCFFACSLPLHARRIEDLNLTERIVLTLANSLEGDEYQYGPDDVSGLVEKAEFLIDEESGEKGEGKGVYAYSFRTQMGGFFGSGYLRIASPSRHVEPKAEEGWELLGEDSETGAGVWFRKIRRSEAIRYNEVQASSRKGNLVLTASLRRPPDETATEARRVILEYFGHLLSNATQYGILSRIVIELLSEEKGQALPGGAVVNIRGSDADETAVRFRVYAADNKGEPLANVDYYAIKLKGALGKFARLEGAAFNQQKNQYEVHDPPKEGIEVGVVFPALNDKEFAGALEQDAKMRAGFGITLDVEATFKPEEKEVVS